MATFLGSETCARGDRGIHLVSYRGPLMVFFDAVENVHEPGGSSTDLDFFEGIGDARAVSFRSLAVLRKKGFDDDGSGARWSSRRSLSWKS